MTSRNVRLSDVLDTLGNMSSGGYLEASIEGVEEVLSALPESPLSAARREVAEAAKLFRSCFSTVREDHPAHAAFMLLDDRLSRLAEAEKS